MSAIEKAYVQLTEKIAEKGRRLDAIRHAVPPRSALAGCHFPNAFELMVAVGLDTACAAAVRLRALHDGTEEAGSKTFGTPGTIMIDGEYNEIERKTS